MTMLYEHIRLDDGFGHLHWTGPGYYRVTEFEDDTYEWQCVADISEDERDIPEGATLAQVPSDLLYE